MLKFNNKTLGKSVKYVQAEITQRKMSGGISMGLNFQREVYYSDGNYLGVIVRGVKARGVIVLGGFHRG